MSEKLVKFKDIAEIKFKLGYEIMLLGSSVIIKDPKTKKVESLERAQIFSDKLLVHPCRSIEPKIYEKWRELFEEI